ncbi:hypothetical protein Q7P37_004058 [Cladosporium fusiforme]
MLPPRLFLLPVIAGTLFVVLIIGIFTTSTAAPAARFLTARFRAENPQFHLLLPATASNPNLCKLLLSGAVTGYPNPVLLGWEGYGQYNGSESHLFKITETLAYLDTLPASSDHDLVLVLDAYDVWLQLRPEVLISRYFTAIDKANARLKKEGILDADHGGAKIKQSILFGPDKVCWPEDERRAACWAVPESSLSHIAFGPATDTWMVPNRPRWLNSGTIMGPAKEMREMFAATMDVVRRKYDEEYKFRNSDQYYFQELFAEQELGRTMRRDGKIDVPLVKGNTTYGILPDIPQGIRTEFHIVMDYESDVFQTSAAYTEYMTWMAFNHSTPLPGADQSNPAAIKRMDQLTLSQDIMHSRPPFSAGEHLESLLRHTKWADLMLGTNLITQQAFPVYHMTGDKSFRKRWWPRMWFYPYAEALLEAEMTRRVRGSAVVAKVRGVEYVGAELDVDEPISGDGVGAWTDRKTWEEWQGMCGEYGNELFGA